MFCLPGAPELGHVLKLTQLVSPDICHDVWILIDYGPWESWQRFRLMSSRVLKDWLIGPTLSVWKKLKDQVVGAGAKLVIPPWNQDPSTKTVEHDRKLCFYVLGVGGREPTFRECTCTCRKLMGKYLIVLCACSLALVIQRDIWTIMRTCVEGCWQRWMWRFQQATLATHILKVQPTVE